VISMPRSHALEVDELAYVYIYMTAPSFVSSRDSFFRVNLANGSLDFNLKKSWSTIDLSFAGGVMCVIAFDHHPQVDWELVYILACSGEAYQNL